MAKVIVREATRLSEEGQLKACIRYFVDFDGVSGVVDVTDQARMKPGNGFVTDEDVVGLVNDLLESEKVNGLVIPGFHFNLDAAAADYFRLKRLGAAGGQ